MFSYGIAFGISKELLEDAIHDVFLHLYEREHKLWESQNMKFYLLNCLKNRIRTIKKKEMNTEFLEEGSDNYSFLIEVNGFELIDEEKERAAMQKQLKKMLDSLTDRQREAVYLRYTQGLSYEEIGKLMGIQPKAAQTRNPVRQALVSSTGTFWDTVVVCLMTGLVLVTSIMKNPAIDMGQITNGGVLTTLAFQQIPVLGPVILVVGIISFAYSTVLGWAYYGERCVEYFAGRKGLVPYRILYIAVAVIAPVISLNLVWTIADILNALMALPNLVAVLLLSNVIVAETKKYINNLDAKDDTEIEIIDR